MGAAMNGLAAIAFETGELAKAESLVRQALEIEPRLRTGRYNLARIREAKGDTAGAEALYREELLTYADAGRARFNLAQIRRARGDRAGYLGELSDCVARAPEFAACYFYLAREELAAGRLDAARDLATRGLEAQPRSEVAPLGHFVLADVYNRRGQAKQAEEEATKGRRLEAALRKSPSPRI
jgi:tetratricopeptide (TPR) repeat protein